MTMFERFQTRLKHYYQSYKKSSINENLILTDIASADLHGSLSKLLNAKYLEDAQENQQKLYTGIRFGQGRLMFSLPTKIKNKTKNAIYLLDTSSPFNYLCEETITAFKVEIPTATFAISISGINCDALVSGIITHFSEMNILGSDFLHKSKAILNFDFEKDVFKIHLR